MQKYNKLLADGMTAEVNFQRKQIRFKHSLEEVLNFTFESLTERG